MDKHKLTQNVAKTANNVCKNQRRSKPPSSEQRIALLGVPVDDLPVEIMIRFIVQTCLHQRKAVIANVNVHALNLAYELPRFRQFLNEVDLVFCDGFGVKWGGYLLGHKLRNRYTPPDWIDLLSTTAEKADLTMYFLGASPGVAQQAAEKLTARHPRLRISGCHHGYFDKRPDSQENLAVIQDINHLKPNILILGFGMPLQELWLKDNWSLIQANVAIPAGAMFDYVAGTIRRGPHWMTDNGFEWLARFLIEPRRLWHRYLIGNPKFLWRVLLQRLNLLRLG
jgi:N-acetylglucosaminyldiphosphoundecaprenol N-acetyl-beta-D-mannosaminyltransferase